MCKSTKRMGEGIKILWYKRVTVEGGGGKRVDVVICLKKGERERESGLKEGIYSVRENRRTLDYVKNWIIW